MFCLYYDAKTKKISAMNGSGRSGAKCTLEAVRKDLGLKDGDDAELPLDSVHAVTIPGAAGGWVDTVERFGSGKLSMEQILAPSIELAEKGFPVSEISSNLVSYILTSWLNLVLTTTVANQRKDHPERLSQLRRDPKSRPPSTKRLPCTPARRNHQEPRSRFNLPRPR